MTTETEDKDKKLQKSAAIEAAPLAMPMGVSSAFRQRLVEAQASLEPPKTVAPVKTDFAPVPIVHVKLKEDDVRDIGDDGISEAKTLTKAQAGDPELPAGTDLANIVSKLMPVGAFLAGGNHRAILGGASPRACLDVPKLDIPTDLPANSRLLIAAKYFVDHALGAYAGDPRLAQLGIDSSHAWCAETMNAITRAAGLKDSGSALALSEGDGRTQIAANKIEPGDFVVHNRGDGHGHTGMVWKVNKDAAGNVTSYVMLNGNSGHQLRFAEVDNPAGYATYYRHSGEAAPMAQNHERHTPDIKEASFQAPKPQSHPSPPL